MNTEINNIGVTARARRMRIADIRCELCNRFLTSLKRARGREHTVDWPSRRTCISHVRMWQATDPKCNVCGATVRSGLYKMRVHSADHPNAYIRGRAYNFCESCKTAGRGNYYQVL